MGTRHNTHTHFHLRLFWSVAAVFAGLCICFAAFQYMREKQFRIDLLDSRLTGYNDYIAGELRRGAAIQDITISGMPRISILDTEGNLIYDTNLTDPAMAGNHAGRREIRQALRKGAGYDVRRRSETDSRHYFYSAKRYGDRIVRSAVPYSDSLMRDLGTDHLYLAVIVAALAVFAAIFHNVTRRLGQNINRLKDFAYKAGHGDMDGYPTRFPNDELGETARSIVQIYRNLQDTRKALTDEQERALRQQEEQARIRRQLTQNMAHELKTPVASIQGYLETIIGNDNMPAETQRDFLSKCYRQSTRLAALLHDMQTLTRIDEAPGLIEREETDIARIIADAADDTALHLKERHMHLHNRTEALRLTCRGNRSLLYSVFRNLIDNSIAYAGEGAGIYIACNTEDPALYHFSYSDSGAGVAEEHLHRIFERFYRIDKGRSRKAGGTGLGLSVVKNAVLLHGGNIMAKKREGGGLEFIFSIKRQ